MHFWRDCLQQTSRLYYAQMWVCSHSHTQKYRKILLCKKYCFVKKQTNVFYLEIETINYIVGFMKLASQRNLCLCGCWLIHSNQFKGSKPLFSHRAWKVLLSESLCSSEHLHLIHAFPVFSRSNDSVHSHTSKRCQNYRERLTSVLAITISIVLSLWKDQDQDKGGWKLASGKLLLT
jgi:hypothetical protein